MPRQSPTTPWVLANCGSATDVSCWLSSLQPTTAGHCKGQEAHGRRRPELGSSGPGLPEVGPGSSGQQPGRSKNQPQPEGKYQPGDLPVQRGGCSLQPFRSVGFRFPGHVDICNEGTRSYDTARPQALGAISDHRAREAQPCHLQKQTPPHLPPHFQLLSACLGPCWTSTRRQMYSCTWPASSFSFTKLLTIYF